MAQRRILRRLHDGLAQKLRQICHIGERRAAFDEELQGTSVLAARAIELHCELLVARHRLVDGLGQRLLLLLSQFLDLCAHIIRQALSCEGYEFCHDIRHVLDGFFSLHRHRSYLSSMLSCLIPASPQWSLSLSFLILIIAIPIS